MCCASVALWGVVFSPSFAERKERVARTLEPHGAKDLIRISMLCGKDWKER